VRERKQNKIVFTQKKNRKTKEDYRCKDIRNKENKIIAKSHNNKNKIKE